jgi:hypothetical protein
VGAWCGRGRDPVVDHPERALTQLREEGDPDCEIPSSVLRLGPQRHLTLSVDTEEYTVPATLLNTAR